MEALLNSHHTHYSTSRLTSHEIVLLLPNMTIHRSLTQLPCCWRSQVSKMKNMIVLFLTDNLSSPRIDLPESPMDNPDFILFTDGSYLRGPQGKYQAGYAVISPVSVLENGPLPDVSSAREAKLIVLTRACQLAKGKSANIYSKSCLCIWGGT